MNYEYGSLVERQWQTPKYSVPTSNDMPNLQYTQQSAMVDTVVTTPHPFFFSEQQTEQNAKVCVRECDCVIDKIAAQIKSVLHKI